MPIDSYSTDVDASRTAGDISALLAKAGARRIMTEYGTDGRATGMTFEIETKIGLQVFNLPIKAHAVQAVLKRQKVTPKYQTIEQAERVAWRIALVWLRAQLALIETETISLDEVMFPWMLTPGGESMHQAFIDHGLKALSAS